MALPFTGPIFNEALKDKLKENGYQDVTADIPGVGTCTILDYGGKHPFRPELRFRKAPRNPKDGSSNNTSNTINLDIMLDDYLRERTWQGKEAEESDEYIKSFESMEDTLFNRVLAEMREMSKEDDPKYRIQATGEYNPEKDGHPLYRGQKVRRLSIIFPTRRTSSPAIEDAEHPERSIDWTFLTAAYPVAIEYILHFGRRYFDEFDKAFPKQ